MPVWCEVSGVCECMGWCESKVNDYGLEYAIRKRKRYRAPSPEKPDEIAL